MRGQMAEVGRANRLMLVTAIALILLAMILGGAIRPLQTIATELAGLAALMAVGLQTPRPKVDRETLAALVLLGLIFLLPLAQLAPLPPAFWSRLPGREPLVEAVKLFALPNRWRPLSLNPDETGKAILFLLAPAGMFLVAVRCDTRQRGWLVMSVLVVACLSLIVGAVQAASGQGRQLQFYDVAQSLPNGFFANRNHQADFMVCCAILTAALPSLQGLPKGLNRRPAFVLGLGFVLVVAATATLSRAGILLLIPALSGALMMQIPRLGRRRRIILVGFVCACLATLGLIIALKGGAIFDRFEVNEAGDLRFSLAPRLIALASGLQPVGGGMGSFDLLYRASEHLDDVGLTFLNHAHDDYIEIWLEGGLAGVILIVAFLIWWARGAARAWLGHDARDRNLARAGSLVTGIMLLHSFVDYPLRTPAMAVLFALACALMIDGAVTQLVTPVTQRDNQRTA